MGSEHLLGCLMIALFWPVESPTEKFPQQHSSPHGLFP